MNSKRDLRHKASQGTELHRDEQWTKSETDDCRSLQRFESTEKENKEVHINSETGKSLMNRGVQRVASRWQEKAVRIPYRW